MKTKLSRKNFLKLGIATGGATLLGECGNLGRVTPEFKDDYPLNKPENVIYSSCLQCNTGCGIKVKIVDGVVSKIDGNPLAPHAMYPHLNYQSPVTSLSYIDGAICPKGQAGIQTAYDPYRLLKVLKRAGKRGENKWVSISFEQAIQEIVEGGKLFSHVKGEEDRVVTGLKDIYKLRDPKIMKEMADEVKHIKEIAKEVNSNKKPKEELKQVIEAFKTKFKDYLDTLIDPEHPDLGPINNQLVFMYGRLKAGRSDFIKRFINESFGSTNIHGHTTICQGSLYFAGKAMSAQWDYDEKSKRAKWIGGDKFYWQGDIGNSEFIIFVGANIFDGNYGPPGRNSRLMTSLVNGKVKYIVIDPRAGKTASKSDKWIPIKPGTDGAFAMAVIRYLIENEIINKTYLENANKGAAKQDNEPNWTNATWLVDIESGKFYRAGKIRKVSKDGEPYEDELFAVMKNGVLVPFDVNGETNTEGDLFVDTEIQGKKIKSVLQLIKESAFEKTYKEWAEICGIEEKDVLYVAKELSKYIKNRKAVVDIHRGVSQHTNGFYNSLAWNTVNALIGNFDYKGGFIRASVFDVSGKKEEQPFRLSKLLKSKMSPFGISIIRHDIKYEETTIFEGYPSKRPFYPHSSDIYQEIIPSIRDQYPYPAKALILYMGSPVYGLPAGHVLIDALMDVEKLPLFIAIDITIGETSLYADYIFPDLTYLERWEFQGSHAGFASKIQPVRQPAIAPIPETVKVFGEEMPISLESFLMACAEKLQMPNFGKNGFKEAGDFLRPEDFYLKCVANIAYDGEPVPDATDEEIDIFVKARKHLPKSVFDIEKWKKALNNDETLFRKVVYVLNRGGRFQNYDKSYDGVFVKNKYGKLINLYSEKVATTKNSITGKKFYGYAKYIPISNSKGEELTFTEEYNLSLITSRTISMTKSRTISNYWLLALMPENHILINSIDANKLKLKNGDRVLVVSPQNPEGVWIIGPNQEKKKMIGKIKIIEGIRPGVISFYLGYGHWAYGSSDIEINGKKIKKDKRRDTGIHANAAMVFDPYLKSSLTDLVGGSVSFYDSKVKLVKV